MCQVMIVKYWTMDAADIFMTWAKRHGWVMMNDGRQDDEGRFVFVMGRKGSGH